MTLPEEKYHKDRGMKPPKGFVYVPVKKATGIDMPGLLAVPENEVNKENENAKDGK